MKVKIWVAIAIGVILTACGRAAADDKIFTSSGQILAGEEWTGVRIYNDDTVVDMLGGSADWIAAYDGSTLNVLGGHGQFEALDYSSINISGGTHSGGQALGSAVVNFSENAYSSALGASAFGTVNMTGGTVEHVGANDSGTINLYGGVVSDYLGASGLAVVNVYGYGFEYDPGGGGLDGGQVRGYWPDDTPFSIDLYGAETYSHVNLISGEVVDVEIDIEPDTINLASKGKWICCKIWLPEDYDVTEIEPNSVRLEQVIAADWVWFEEEEQVAMAKFRRSEVKEIVEPGVVELTVRGELMDGTPFEGTDTIRVMDRGRVHGQLVNSESKIEDGIEYYIETSKCVYTFGENVEMLYKVTNLRDEEVTFSFPRKPVWNFWVEKGQENIWRALNAWQYIMTEFTLSPGESKDFPTISPPYIWNMRDNENNLVNAGKYNVIGGLDTGSGLYDYSKVAVPIKIILRR